MTPIDWNDSEPCFPDFLPPPKPAKLTASAAAERISGVLKAAGITLNIGGCGCCGSPFVEVSFPDGTKGDFDDFKYDLGAELPRR